MNDDFKINVYCENARIIAFLRYILSEKFYKLIRKLVPYLSE